MSFQHVSAFLHGPVVDNSPLRVLLDKHVPEVWQHHELSATSTGCLLSDLQAYLSNVLVVLPTLVDRLTCGSHIEAYINDHLDRMDTETDFSDFSTLEHLGQKMESLRALAYLTRDRALALSIKQALEPANNHCPDQHQTPSHIPQSRTRRPERMRKSSVRLHPSSVSSPPTYTTSPTPAAEPTWPSITQHKVVPMHTTRSSSQGMSGDPRGTPISSAIPTDLSIRGRGNHTCPHGLSCKLGGIGRDGKLTVFGRNSAFKAHLEKHSRPFRCNLPNCPNKKGFARIDQLTRHQEITKHKP